jgi:hypothetical protein
MSRATFSPGKNVKEFNEGKLDCKDARHDAASFSVKTPPELREFAPIALTPS